MKNRKLFLLGFQFSWYSRRGNKKGMIGSRNRSIRLIVLLNDEDIMNHPYKDLFEA